MKNTLLKKVLITLSLLISVMYIGVALADDLPGALGEPAAATDMYQVSCFDNGSGVPDHLYLEIRGNSNVGGLKVSAQVFKDGTAFNTTDAANGDQVYSPRITFKGGDAGYILTVDKSAAGVANYNIVFHCQTSTDNHTGTNSTPVQDQ